jgi:alanyl-tRNA synthetase
MPPATERLYLRDPFLFSFDARVVALSRWKDAPSVLLDRSAFYPEGGGQLGDHGTLRGSSLSLDIIDVQVDEDGVVHHVLTADPVGDVVGAEVAGAIDADRRRDFMSQHTGQHMLSSALLEVGRAETVSSRLGAETSTIDVNVAGLDEKLAALAEESVTSAVLGDRAIRVLFPTPEELRALPLRRQPKVDVDVRIVDIEGFDTSPCGGTHCTRTGQVGPVRITGMERYKGGTRVTFVAGRRALSDYAKKDAVLRELSRGFTCGPLDVPAAVGKLRAELRARMDLLGETRGELMALLAERLFAAHPVDPSGTTIIVSVRDNDDLGASRALAGALAKRPDVVAICASRDPDGGHLLVVVERGSSATFDAGAWLKRQAAAHGGRGGGRPERAEGRLDGSVDLAALARA